MNYSFDWSVIWEYRELIVRGFINTVLLSMLGLIFAALLGVLMGTLASAHSRRLRWVATIYVETARNIPLLVHMYFWYIALAYLRLPAFTCAVLGLSIYSGAYVTEVVRSGIAAVPRGQYAAALATGLPSFAAMRRVVYPQALKIVTPSLAGLASQLIKDSSLASVIAVAELTYQAGAIEGLTFRTFEAYIFVSLLYLALVTIVSQTLMLLTRTRKSETISVSEA